MSSNFNSDNLTPLIKAKKFIAIYPTITILLGYISSIIYSSLNVEYKYMDYIDLLYIFLLCLMIIFSCISRYCICKTLRRNAGILLSNKGKGAIMCLISFKFFGYTQNLFHFIMNILLVIMGIILLILDFLIVGNWEKREENEVTDGSYCPNKRDVPTGVIKGSDINNVSQLDKSEDEQHQNNPYAIPQDF